MSITAIIAILLVACIAWRLTRRKPNQHTPSSWGKPRFEEATMLYAVDGDTIDVRLADNTTERIRVIGIDAPESLHPDESRNCEAGRLATAFARQLCRPNTKVWLERDWEERDCYGRLLRHVWLEDPKRHTYEDASMECIMVRAGHAKPDPHPRNNAHTAAIAICAAKHSARFARHFM